MKLDESYSTKVGSHSGSETAYSVEARYNYISPAKIGKQLFDNRWRTVEFDASSVGVPRAPSYQRETLNSGLLSYSAAQALRWWLHALADYEGHSCIETRLIKHKISFSMEIVAVSSHAEIGGDNKSSMMPDYGKD
jgi:hypothetical protein